MTKKHHKQSQNTAKLEKIFATHNHRKLIALIYKELSQIE